MNDKTVPQMIEELKAMQKKRAQGRAMATSRTQRADRQREAARAKAAKKIAATLTKNLPDADLNPNQRRHQLLTQIGKAAFCSALENGVVFIAKDNNTLKAQNGSMTTEIKPRDLDSAALDVFNWSGVIHRLKDDNGHKPHGGTLFHTLIIQAGAHKVQQGKRKSFDSYLQSLVDAVTSTEVEFEGAKNRTALLEKFGEFIAGVSVDIGLQAYRDRQRNLYLNCSNKKFGLLKVETKNVLPYFDEMAKNGPAAGRLKATRDGKSLLKIFISKMPLT